ncbi:ABC transporter permease, partial [bacterium]
LFVLMAVNGLTPHWSWLLLPVWIGLITIFALGGGLFFGALMVSYRDVQYVLPVLVSLLTFASPVAYPVSYVTSKLPEALHPAYFLLNPLASLLSAFRWSMLGQGEVNWFYVGFASIVSIAAFMVGSLAFKSMEARFVDVI